MQYQTLTGVERPVLTLDFNITCRLCQRGKNMNILVMYLLFYATILRTVLCGKLFKRSQSLNLTRPDLIALTLDDCALLCHSEELCIQAEFQEEKQMCVLSRTWGPLYLGNAEPDLTAPVSIRLHYYERRQKFYNILHSGINVWFYGYANSV